MTSLDDWAELDPEHWLVLVPDDEPAAAGRANVLRGRGPFVAIVQGKRMRTFECMHHELAAAMQFPSYYGENSNAFFDCIRDLSWLGDVGLVLLITDASQVLLRDEHGPETFWSGLVDARDAWRHPVEEHFLRTQPAPYTVILQDSKAALNRLVETSESLSRALGR